MNLTRDSWHHKFYIANFQKHSDKNFCNYFWSLLLAAILTPFTWITFAIQYFAAVFKQEIKRIESYEGGRRYVTVQLNYWERFWSFDWKLLPRFMIGLILQGFLSVMIHSLIHNPGGTLRTMGYALMVIIAIVGFIFLCIWFAESETKEKINTNLQEFGTIVSTGFKTFKDKHCPIISWKD